MTIRTSTKYHWLLLLPALTILLTAAACNDDGQRAAASSYAMDLRVMTFNIEWGGANISFDNVVEAIRRSRADIVGIQEAEGNLRRLATDLGWYYDERNYAISKFRLLDPPGANGRYILVEVEPGKVVALANVHLPSDPYGADLVRDGATVDEVLDLERAVRLPMIVPFLAALKPLIEDNVPVFLTGDFNAPAHTDWTREMVGERAFLSYPVPWPVSQAVANAGLHDSWRVTHPDPRKDPGLTWWARRPPLELYAPGENDAEDRIDFVWYAGPAEVQSSQIVGEENMPGVSISVAPWPSDHRGVVSLFSVVPAETPELVATTHRIYHGGEDIEVAYRRAAEAQVRIGKVATNNDLEFIASEKVSGDGRLTFAADRFPAGHYRLEMAASNSQSLHSEFWVLDKDAVPEVEVVGESFDRGESIDITWRNGPGFRNDYLAIVKKGAISDYDGGSSWLYVNARPEGRVSFGIATAETSWPVPPGDYVVRLIEDDGYEVLAESATFTVR